MDIGHLTTPRQNKVDLIIAEIRRIVSHKRFDQVKPIEKRFPDCEPRCKILNARIRNVSRDVIAFDFDESTFTKGELPLSWEILAHQDGAVVQITYVGDTDVYFSIEGVIEGQSQIGQYQYGTSGGIGSSSRKPRKPIVGVLARDVRRLAWTAVGIPSAT